MQEDKNYQSLQKTKKRKNIGNHIETFYGISEEKFKRYEAQNKLNNKNVIYKKRSSWFALIAPATASTNRISDNSENINKNIQNFWIVLETS